MEICSWKIGGSVEIGECLFFSPNVQTIAEALAIEDKSEGNPGFVVAKWTL